MLTTLLLSAGLLAFAANPSPASAKEVVLKNARGQVVGNATLTPVKDGIEISLQASQLSPGQHGIHLHESGRCQSPDFKSAGPHLNPAKKMHGLENPKGSHAGDLPNLEVKEDGTVSAKMTAKGVHLAKTGDSSLVSGDGTALVIHAKADDHKTDPSGDSGDRIACAEIR